MRYWLTTHWPPRDTVNQDPLGVWLQDGHTCPETAVEKGDLVFIYQTAGGKSRVETTADGNKITTPCLPGRKGVVKLIRITAPLIERDRGEWEEVYADGSKRLWRYFAEGESINSAGYVRGEQVAGVLEYAPNYTFRSLGARHSGLKELTESQYNELLRLFVGSAEVSDANAREVLARARGIGPGGEGPAHLALKMAIAKDPSGVLGESGLTLWAVEYLLPTGDKIDVVLQDSFGRFVAVEVEVDCAVDEIVGPMQCMKYRALVSFAMDREMDEVRAILVAHSIHDEVSVKCERFSIECRTVTRPVAAGDACHQPRL